MKIHTPVVVRAALLITTHLLPPGVNTCVAAPAKPEPVGAAAVNKPPVYVDLQSSFPDGYTAGPVTAERVTVQYKGKPYKGVKFTFVHGEGWDTISMPVQVSALEYNTWKFKVLTDDADADFSFGVQLRDKKGGWNAANYLHLAGPRTDKWREFSWDVVNQPQTVMGIDLGAVTYVDLRPNFPGIPEGKKVNVTIIDMRFVAGEAVATGDPALFKKWTAYIDQYKPDYSDSSAHLLPPATGRIATPVAIVRDGAPLGKIVMPGLPSDPLALAGRELQHWIKAISGATLPVVKAEPGETAPRLILGTKLAAGKFDADIAWLGKTDGYAVRTRYKDIFIFGATDKGTLNGAFAFLENNTDLIWPRPRQELGSVYSNNPNLQIIWADARRKPVSRLRGWGTGQGLRVESEIWSVRNGENYALGGGFVRPDGVRRKAQGGFVEYGGGHNIGNFIGKTSEFYPVIGGKKPEVWDIWKHQPNFTAPGIVETVSANVLKYIKEEAPPKIDCINVNIEDNWGVSEDAKSLEPIRLPSGELLKSTDPAFRSTQFFQFLNKVTKNINKVYPDLMVGTYAYFFTANAPKIPIDPHIRVYLCPYVRPDHRSPLFSPINNHWWNQVTAWAKLTDNVVMREYYGINTGFRPLAEVVAYDVDAYNTLGVKEFTSEINPDDHSYWGDENIRGAGHEWDFTAMEYWVIDRLYWDPKQDVEQLRKYYLRRTYREAAPAMEKFFGTIRAHWFSNKNPSDFVDGADKMMALYIQAGLEEPLRAHLAEAAAAVRHPVSKMAVDVIRLRFETWVRWAKNRDLMFADWKLVGNTALLYGWGAENDWDTNRSWASVTWASVNGATVPALRISVKPAKAGDTDGEVNNSIISGAQAGDSFCTTIRPVVPLEAGKTLSFTLTATDKAGVSIVAPPVAMTAGPDGSVKVDWKLVSEPGAAAPFDVTQMKNLKLSFPDSSLLKDALTQFHVIQPSIGPPP